MYTHLFTYISKQSAEAAITTLRALNVEAKEAEILDASSWTLRFQTADKLDEGTRLFLLEKLVPSSGTLFNQEEDQAEDRDDEEPRDETREESQEQIGFSNEEILIIAKKIHASITESPWEEVDQDEQEDYQNQAKQILAALQAEHVLTAIARYVYDHEGNNMPPTYGMASELVQMNYYNEAFAVVEHLLERNI